jgi:hypothetical protein
MSVLPSGADVARFRPERDGDDDVPQQAIEIGAPSVRDHTRALRDLLTRPFAAGPREPALPTRGGVAPAVPTEMLA